MQPRNIALACALLGVVALMPTESAEAKGRDTRSFRASANVPAQKILHELERLRWFALHGKTGYSGYASLLESAALIIRKNRPKVPEGPLKTEFGLALGGFFGTKFFWDDDLATPHPGPGFTHLNTDWRSVVAHVNRAEHIMMTTK